MTPAMRALHRLRKHPPALDACARALRLNIGPGNDHRLWSELEEVEREMWRRRMLARQLAVVRKDCPDGDGGGLPMEISA